MAITIDATVGGTASNSYLTLNRANELAEQLPHADEWFSEIGINKAQLIVHATRMIDQSVRFLGTRTSDAQALEWPRQGVTHERTGDLIGSATIPDFVEWATIEWAYAFYLEGANTRIVAPGLKTLRTPSYQVEFGGSPSRRMPAAVADLLYRYGESKVQSVTLMRA